MTYLTNNYGIVKFDVTQNYKITDKHGIYRIVALPISFSFDNETLIKEYIEFFKKHSISSWNGDIKSKSKFNNGELSVDFQNYFETDILKFLQKGVDWSNEEEAFEHLKKIVHFLPTLYVGKAKEQSLKSRFTQHLNSQKENALINRIEKYELFKKCYKLYIWLEIEDEYIDAFESLLIQTTNPIFNKQRS